MPPVWAFRSFGGCFRSGDEPFVSPGTQVWRPKNRQFNLMNRPGRAWSSTVRTKSLCVRVIHVLAIRSLPGLSASMLLIRVADPSIVVLLPDKFPLFYQLRYTGNGNTQRQDTSTPQTLGQTIFGADFLAHAERCKIRNAVDEISKPPLLWSKILFQGVVCPGCGVARVWFDLFLSCLF